MNFGLSYRIREFDLAGSLPDAALCFHAQAHDASLRLPVIPRCWSVLKQFVPGLALASAMNARCACESGARYKLTSVAAGRITRKSQAASQAPGPTC